jgi:exodeoxyribonuclease V alpha subunit
MIPTLDALLKNHYLSDLDYHFALTAARISGEEDPLVLLGAAVASRFTNIGHICANISVLAGESIETAEGEPMEDFNWPDATSWRKAIEGSPMVARGDNSAAPLVLAEDDGLYLYRYWIYQKRLANQLRIRASQEITNLDEKTLTDGINRLFPSPEAQGKIDEQRLAARMILKNILAVVSGGPGTGKTSAVVKILALLIEQAAFLGRERPAILLMAPTGKAAARLTESIRKTKNASGAMALDCQSEITSSIPEEASTIHRALGSRFDKPTQFRYHADNPLPAEVVVVDEASMVDLALMTKLVEAVKPNARLILLGDKDQLTSVGAGAILGDIYNAFSSQVSPYQHCIVHFTHSYRFNATSGMGNLARAINRGDADKALAYLNDPQIKEVELIHMPQPLKTASLRSVIEPFVSDLSRHFEHTDPKECLAIQSAFRILCAHRHGLAGAVTVNQMTESILRDKGLIRSGADWYAGRPIIINQNDYQIELFNGDVGVLGAGDGASGDLHALFSKIDGGIRRIAPSRLPSHDTVYAMTVHKSQGSEFDRVLVILPDRPSPVVTRELLYTAVTRAKKKLFLFSSEETIRAAIQTRVQRASGLTNQLG